jgi:hypothetical protein
MKATIHQLSMDVVRAEALFASTLQPSDDPGAEQIRCQVTCVVRDLGVRGCAERVAQEFGDHPELAVARMRWARGLVEITFGQAAHRNGKAGHAPHRTFTLPVASAPSVTSPRPVTSAVGQAA